MRGACDDGGIAAEGAEGASGDTAVSVSGCRVKHEDSKARRTLRATSARWSTREPRLFWLLILFLIPAAQIAFDPDQEGPLCVL